MAEQINLISGTVLTAGVLITDVGTVTGGAVDAIPQRTIVNNQIVDAAVEIQSTEGGFLFPRMTNTQMNALITTNGMVIYNTTFAALYVYSSGAWMPLVSGSGGSVTSISQGTNMSFSVNPITTTGTINLSTTLTGLVSVAVGNLTLSSNNIAASGTLVLQTNGTTTALTLDTSQNATVVGNITSNNGVITSGTSSKTGSFVAFSSSGGKITQTIAPMAAAANYTVTWPAAVASVSGYVLSSDTSGNLSWVSPSPSGTVNTLAYFNSGGTLASTSITCDGSNVTTAGFVKAGTITLTSSNINSTGSLFLATNGTTTALTINASQNAIFAGNVSVGNISLSGSTIQSSGSLIFNTGGATTALTLNSSQNAVFAGSIIMSSSGGGSLTQSVPSITSGNAYTITWPATVASSNGQVLTSTNAGVLSWTSPAAGTVTSITQGTNMSFSVSPITTTGTINLASTLTGLTSVGVGNLTLSGGTIKSSSTMALATNGSTTAISIDNSQNSSFSGQVIMTANGATGNSFSTQYQDGTDTSVIGYNTGNFIFRSAENIQLQANGGFTAVTIDTSLNSSFNGDVNISANGTSSRNLNFFSTASNGASLVCSSSTLVISSFGNVSTGGVILNQANSIILNTTPLSGVYGGVYTEGNGTKHNVLDDGSGNAVFFNNVTVPATLSGNNTGNINGFQQITAGYTRSASAWGTVGCFFNSTPTTGNMTDTSSSGTVSQVVLNSFQSSGINASSATTYTNASTVYIAGAPGAGTNVTITNDYSLYINSGASFFGGNITGSNNIIMSANSTSVGLMPFQASQANGGVFMDSSFGNFSFSGGTTSGNWTLNSSTGTAVFRVFNHSSSTNSISINNGAMLLQSTGGSVGFTSPTSMSSSYTITYPAAAPTDNGFLNVANSGLTNWVTGRLFVQSSGTQSIPSLTNTNVNFATTNYNDGGVFTIATNNKFTNTSGSTIRVLIIYSIYWATTAAAGTALGAWIAINGGSTNYALSLDSVESSGIDNTNEGSIILTLANNDFINVIVNQSTAGSLNIGGSGSPFLNTLNMWQLA